MNSIIQGDCLQEMRNIHYQSIDMILTDLPYGLTSCGWDCPIHLVHLWIELKRLIKDNGAIVLTASQPFTSKLIMSNLEMFKYCWIWEKSNPSNIALANIQPLKYHEDICVFSKGNPIFNKQLIKRESPRIKQAQDNGYKFHNSGSEQTGLGYVEVESDKYNPDFKNPSSIIKINSLRPNSREFVDHPTQKPLALFEYLIKTYTNEGNTVLDCCAGSGTTAVACTKLNRNYVCIEKEEKYFKIIKERLSNTDLPLVAFNHSKEMQT